MRHWTATLVLLLVPGLAAGESLGEAARKAREQREAKAKAKAAQEGQAAETAKEPAPPRTYTMEDLQTLPEVQTEVGGDQTGAPPSTSSAPSPSLAAPVPALKSGAGSGVTADERARAEQETTWRARIGAARARVDQTTKAVEFHEKITMVPNSRVVDKQTGKVLFNSIEELQSATATARAAMEQAKKDLAALEEEARRQNVPPGWLR